MPVFSAQQTIAGFVTDAASVPAASTPRMPAAAAQLPGEFFFQLQILEEIPPDPFASAKQIDLQPGQRIHVRVTAGDNGTDGQKSFRIRRDVWLALFCVGEPAYEVARLRVARTDIETLEHDFEVTLPEETPRGDLVLRLFMVEDGRNQKFTAAELTRFVAGSRNPVDRTLLDSVKVQLNAMPPDQVAILHIESPSENTYRMRGWNRQIDPLKTEVDKPNERIGLADFVEGKVSPEAVRGIIQSVSRRTSQPLLRWLQQLLARHGQQLCLIICDHTDAETPWEMIEFDHGRHLGAACAVSRWIPIQDFASWQNLLVDSQQSAGSVVAHLDYSELKHTGAEKQVLTELNADFRNDAKGLRQRLGQSLQNIGLVYLACHGMFTYNAKHQAAVGSLRNPSARISAVQLEDLQRTPGERPLFFVNACHSARVMRDGSGFYGLPEVLLALVASGYIGTLGPVGTEYAPSIGRRLLEKARTSLTGISPAEELQSIRADAIRRLDVDPSDENMLNFVFAFMYVYYGNPLARLRLVDSGAGSGQ